MSSHLLAAAVAMVCGVVVVLSVGGSGEHSSRPRSFLGIVGSPAVRLLSRMMTDRGDDALHGGATHDVRFSPSTAPGSFVARVARLRGEAGAKARQRGGTATKDAYSKDVGRWVTVARGLDPGNFDALLAYCHYLYEGGFPVEVGGGEAEVGFTGLPGQVPLEARKQNVAKAVREFFQKSPLNDKAAWYSAAAAVQILHEADPVHFGVRRDMQARRLRALMRMLVAGGDSCDVVWGSEQDAKAARQFAAALIHTLDEAEELRQEGGKNTLFKRSRIP